MNKRNDDDNDDSSPIMKKSVRINDKAEDLREAHAARLGLKLRRMKRKLLLDAVADDPTNSGYNSSVRSTFSNSSIPSSSSLRDDDDDDGEASFRRGRMVRYNAGSRSVIFNSSTSVFSELSENDLDDINQAVEQRRDDIDY